MSNQINGWTALVVAVALILGYAFALVNMRMIAPVMAAQVAANQQLIQNINTNFVNYDKALAKRFQQDEARIAKLEAKK